MKILWIELRRERDDLCFAYGDRSEFVHAPCLVIFKETTIRHLQYALIETHVFEFCRQVVDATRRGSNPVRKLTGFDDPAHE